MTLAFGMISMAELLQNLGVHVIESLDPYGFAPWRNWAYFPGVYKLTLICSDDLTNDSVDEDLVGNDETGTLEDNEMAAGSESGLRVIP